MTEEQKNELATNDTFDYSLPELNGLSRSDTMIVAFEDKKIREIPMWLQNENKEELQRQHPNKNLYISPSHPLREVIKYVFILMGFTEGRRPNPTQMGVLYEFIYSQLSRFSLSDFKVAFNLAIKGELYDIKENKILNMRFYKTVTPILFADVMEAYERYRHLTIANYRRDLYKKQQEELKKDKEYTEDEVRKIHESYVREVIVKDYQNLLNGNGLKLAYAHTNLYRNLVIEEIIDAEAYKDFLDKAKDQYMDSLKRGKNRYEKENLKKIKQVIEKEGIMSTSGDKVIDIAQRLYVVDWYKRLKEESVTTDQLLEMFGLFEIEN